MKEKFNLHGFADASGKAYAAVVYYETKDGMQILMSRSRVAPIKPISIPRMELKAAALLAELLHFLKSTIEVNRVNAYSDSQAVLAWLTSGERQPVFIRNRVNKIQRLIPAVSWKFVEGEVNPADISSRSFTLKELIRNEKWWQGPPTIKITCMMVKMTSSALRTPSAEISTSFSRPTISRRLPIQTGRNSDKPAGHHLLELSQPSHKGQQPKITQKTQNKGWKKWYPTQTKEGQQSWLQTMGPPEEQWYPRLDGHHPPRNLCIIKEKLADPYVEAKKCVPR